MDEDMKLYQEEQKSAEYLNKLTGKKVIDFEWSYITGVILGLDSVRPPFNVNGFPESVRYKTDFEGFFVLPFFVVMQLIESGEAEDKSWRWWRWKCS